MAREHEREGEGSGKSEGLKEGGTSERGREAKGGQSEVGREGDGVLQLLRLTSQSCRTQELRTAKQAVKEAHPGAVVEDECLDICGGGSWRHCCACA